MNDPHFAANFFVTILEGPRITVLGVWLYKELLTESHCDIDDNSLIERLNLTPKTDFFLSRLTILEFEIMRKLL